MEPQPINYQNKKTKTKPLTTRRKIVLVVLLASLSMNTIQIGKDIVNHISDDVLYSKDNNTYSKMVNENTQRTMDGENYFYNLYEIAKDIKYMPFEDKQDFYHILIKTVYQFDYDKQENFNTLITALNLDTIAFSDDRFPTKKELEHFLTEYGLYNEDGTINFEEWRNYDQKTVVFENEMKKEAEERKSK